MSERKHILFISGWYPSRVMPLNGDFVQRHAEAVSLAHNVSVLHIVSDKNSKEKIELTSSTKNGVKTHIAYIKYTKNPFQKGLRFFNAFKRLINKIGAFDVVHLNKLYPFGIFALYLKWTHQKPFIITEHWTGYHLPQAKNISGVELFISKLIGKHAKFICPVSRDLQNSMEEIGISGNYEVVPNVVDVSVFKPKEKENKEFTILHVSNMLDPHKNVSGIIQTIKKFASFTENFKLVLLGNNSMRYRKISEELALSTYIDFIDHVPHQEVVGLMQGADVFVLFSNYENLPCVILESFACGVPVISSDVGGISEYFPEDCGFLISPGSQEELLEKLIEVYKNQNFDKEKLHLYAKDNFSRSAIAQKFSNLYCN